MRVGVESCCVRVCDSLDVRNYSITFNYISKHTRLETEHERTLICSRSRRESLKQTLIKSRTRRFPINRVLRFYLKSTRFIYCGSVHKTLAKHFSSQPFVKFLIFYARLAKRSAWQRFESLKAAKINFQFVLKSVFH